MLVLGDYRQFIYYCFSFLPVKGISFFLCQHFLIIKYFVQGWWKYIDFYVYAASCFEILQGKTCRLRGWQPILFYQTIKLDYGSAHCISSSCSHCRGIAIIMQKCQMKCLIPFKNVSFPDHWVKKSFLLSFLRQFRAIRTTLEWKYRLLLFIALNFADILSFEASFQRMFSPSYLFLWKYQT